MGSWYDGIAKSAGSTLETDYPALVVNIVWGTSANKVSVLGTNIGGAL